jgi:hypothetical protein
MEIVPSLKQSMIIVSARFSPCTRVAAVPILSEARLNRSFSAGGPFGDQIQN